MTLEAMLSVIDAKKSSLDMLRLLDKESIRNAVLVEYTFESNRIEGNTLTLRETDIVINKGLTIAGKSMREHLEAINHNEAIMYLLDFVRGDIEFDERIVKDLHSIILRGIDRDNAGKYRNVSVMISGSRHVPPSPIQVPDLMLECFKWYKQNLAICHPIILAAEMHERIATIHPFIDGNGRTARLVMNLILMRNGYPIANIPGDGDSRRDYFDSLEKCNIFSDKEDFFKLIIRFVDSSYGKYVGL
jgi:Fic family protein